MAAEAGISMPEAVTRAFRDIYWNKAAPWTRTFWRGHQVAKCPMDLWIYQEILVATKPDLLIETGTCIGGSAYFFASIMDLIQHGMVLTIDKDVYPNQPQHPRISYVVGSSIDRAIIQGAERTAAGLRTMVVLDSLHTIEQVCAELANYAPLVSPGCYLVVEDTGVDESWGIPAAHRAVQSYINMHPEFVIDRDCERHLLTLNPGGWLKRVV